MPTVRSTEARDTTSLPRAVGGVSPIAPLNVWSRSPEETGRALSNWAHLPFVLDGMEYASVEGLYASLLQQDPAKRAVVRSYWGIRAKRAIPKRRSDYIQYQGREIAYRSPDFYALIEAGIRAKLAQHSEVARAFVATRPRPIIHDTGYPRTAGRGAQGEGWFCTVLTAIREELFRAVTDELE